MQSNGLTTVASLLCGALSVLAFAPLGWWLIFPFTLAMFFVLLFNATTKGGSFRVGYFFGVGLFGAGIYWVYFSLHLFGSAIAPLAALGTLLCVLVLALFPACFALVAQRFSKNTLWFILAAPALWLLFEWIRSWFLTGFPWLSAGYTTIHSPLAGYAPIGGVFLNSLLIALCSGLVAWSVHTRRVISIVVTGVFVAAISAGGYWLKAIEWTKPLEDRTVDVTMVQGNVSQQLKFQPTLIEDSLELYSSLSQTSAELIIWPESAIPTLYSDVTDWEQRFATELKQQGSTVISGGFTSNGDYSKFYNAIKVLNGTEDQVYVKRHLVPFGEFIPFKGLVSKLSQYIDIPMSDLTPGTGPVRPIAVNGINYGMSICYEDAFGNEMRSQFPAANVLINVSNDAWFGDSTAPHQHQEIAAMRSLEFARPMLRVTNTGVTSLIDHFGKIVSEGPQFMSAALDVVVTPRIGSTPYVRIGDWLAVGLACFMLMVAWLLGRRS